MKELIRNSLRKAGFEMRRVDRSLPGTASRPVGELQPVLEDLAARGFRPKSVLDVGANKGEWSRTAKEAFPSDLFTLVEPQVEMKPYLDQFCAQTPNARWINAGAGAEIGELNFAVLPDTVSSSFLVEQGQNEAPGAMVRKVPVVTVDSLYFASPQPAQPLPELVKLDVEGFELEVLRGASRLLKSRAAEVFMVEAAFFSFAPRQPVITEIIQFMAEQNYHVYDFSWFCRRPLDGALALAEVVFVLDQSALRASKAWR